ncbi:SDR family oxidoreductase, partial [Klebsiella pneumoniae]|uniref:SDR family oxidoreductase n=1 Tax=Klebsiella pneumoniae TaxID=573 RepID=UPI00371DE291
RKASSARSTTAPPRPALSASPRRWRWSSRRSGITVNAVAPGYIATDMVAAVPPKVLTAIKEAIPVAHLGSPDDVARCVAFLVADEASYITGATLTVNGGQYMT